MSGEEAKEYGIIDEVIVSKDGGKPGAEAAGSNEKGDKSPKG